MEITKFTTLTQYSSLATNLKKLMEHNEITLSALNKKTGIPLGTISRLLSNDLQNPTIASLVPLAKLFHVTIDQLIGAELLPKLTGSSTQQSNNKWHSVPLITWEYAQNWVEEKHHKVYLYKHPILTDIELTSNAFALIVEHEDWQFFPRSTVLIIEPSLEPKHRDYVVIVKKENKNKSSATLRQLLIDGNEKYLKPLNPEFKICSLTAEDKILGVMKQSRRDY
jgi:SOS-response transcriptional repressor LexA